MQDETLTPDRVREIMFACLFKQEEIVDGEPPRDAIVVDGITSKFGFHPGRVAESKPAIKALLDELPRSFASSDGDSFLNACVDRNGRHWGEHPDMQALMVLGFAAGFIWMLPREFWMLCPGNVPVFGIKAEAPTQSIPD